MKSKALALALTFLLSAIALGCLEGEQQPTQPYKKSWLEIRNGSYILHLRGSYYDMGYAHGKLLSEQVREDVDGFINWAERRGCSFSEQLKMYKKAEPYIPKKYKDEMEGLAEGSGVPLDRIHAIHAIPMKFHCSGLLAYGEATVDGALYHTRSLDYAIDIQDPQTGKRVQENSLITIYEPDGAFAWVNIGWAGWIGCLGGMNEEGISVGEMGSSSSDETLSGLPMIFRLRRIMEEASDLSKALGIMQADRTCGYNFLIGDANAKDARVIEQTAHDFYAGAWADEVEERYPHWKIKNVVRRTNHFISDLAYSQRQDQLSKIEVDAVKTYLWLNRKEIGLDREDINDLNDGLGCRDDERQLPHLHFLNYAIQSKLLEKELGKINGESIGEVMRKSYQAFNNFGKKAGFEIKTLYQAVFAPSSGDLWVSNAGRASSAYQEPLYHYNFNFVAKKSPSQTMLGLGMNWLILIIYKP